MCGRILVLAGGGCRGNRADVVERRENETNNSLATKIIEGGGGEGARAEILFQPVMKTMVKQASPLQPMEVSSEVNIHL